MKFGTVKVVERSVGQGVGGQVSGAEVGSPSHRLMRLHRHALRLAVHSHRPSEVEATDGGDQAGALGHIDSYDVEVLHRDHLDGDRYRWRGSVGD